VAKGAPVKGDDERARAAAEAAAEIAAEAEAARLRALRGDGLSAALRQLARDVEAKGALVGIDPRVDRLLAAFVATVRRAEHLDDLTVAREHLVSLVREEGAALKLARREAPTLAAAPFARRAVARFVAFATAGDGWGPPLFVSFLGRLRMADGEPLPELVAAVEAEAAGKRDGSRKRALAALFMALDLPTVGGAALRKARQRLNKA
jgi:hypothetical protein